MLVRLKGASRRNIALVWAMTLVFALAPGLSMAFAAPVGAFSRFLVHAHADDEPGHVHHGHHHHHHHAGHQDDGDHHHHDDDGGTSDTQDRGQQSHVHYDACCPSVVMPSQGVSTLRHRLADRITIHKVEPMQGAPPDRLLRPPIPVLV